MCSAFTHAALGLVVARVGTGARMPARYWISAAALAAAPDLDALGYVLWQGWWEPDGLWSHRGMTHSLSFAVLAAGLVTLAMFPRGRAGVSAGSVAVVEDSRWRSPIARWRVWVILTLAMFSHGLTDMLTNGGSGVAVFAPVSLERHRWAFRPVEVSPISVGGFFNQHGLEILWNELRWVLLPALGVAGVVEVVRWWRRAGPDGRRGASH